MQNIKGLLAVKLYREISLLVVLVACLQLIQAQQTDIAVTLIVKQDTGSGN